MPNVGTLDLLLRARTAAFVRGIDKAKRATSSFVSNLASATIRIAKFGSVAVGTGLAIGTFIVRQQLEAITTTTKLANRIGISTEALIGLQQAAKITGVSTTALSLSLERFTRRLGEAVGGTGATAKALETLGLSARKMIKLDLDESFKLVADRLAGLKTAGARANIAFKLFGRSGVELLDILVLQRKGIDKIQTDAKKLGLTFTELAGVKVKAANEALNRATTIVSSLARTITIQLAPMIEVAANKFVDWAASGDGLRVKITTAMEFIGRGIAKVIGLIDLANIGFLKLQILAKQAEQVARIAIGAQTFGGISKESSKRVVSLTAGISNLRVEIDKLQKSLREGTREKAFLAFFKNLAKEADAAATAAVKAMLKTRGAFADGGLTAAGPTRAQARVLDPSLTFIPAIRSLQNAVKKNPQISKTNQILTDIRNIVTQRPQGIF